jgi:hypothetical protein
MTDENDQEGLRVQEGLNQVCTVLNVVSSGKVTDVVKELLNPGLERGGIVQETGQKRFEVTGFFVVS